MKYGFLTNSLVKAGMQDLDVIAKWAVENGFSDLEVGPTVPLSEDIFNSAKEKYKIDISTLIFCRNFLMADQEEADALMSELVRRIEFASKIGAKKMVTTTGIADISYANGYYSPEASLEAVKKVFTPVVDLAEKKNVDILIEMCPFMGNIAVSPYMLDLVFDVIDSDRLGIVYDPSHLVWQQIDGYGFITKYAKRIRHVHGKDCEVNHEAIKSTGVRHFFNVTHTGSSMWEVHDAGLSKKEASAQPKRRNLWWRYRLPGLGDMDWGKIVSLLQEINYDGTISIEHEDPVWEGSEEKVKKGILAAKKHIEQYVI